ncbi:hypothetical protein RJT34_03354 [Clitoria ternatea]|uniref:Uncharacterized protein n=1 Tax=Clitoria ternatea TaxID=43366 RepID=A0AAN9Q2G2_CLITE
MNTKFNMKWSDLEAGCKEHPNNKQLPGVCSSCLRDKLSKLCDNQPTPRSPFTSSQSFSYNTAASLNYVSPAHRRRHRRQTSNVTDSVSSMISFNHGLKKSNSIAFASRSLRMDREVTENDRGGKKGSFWSKLLKMTRKNTKGAFMHSRTTREGVGIFDELT